MDPIELLKRVDAQTVGKHLRASIKDDRMIQVYLSAKLMRQIAKACDEYCPKPTEDIDESTTT